MNEPACAETLNPEAESQAAPCSDEVLRRLPEENSDTATCNTGNGTSQNEQPAKTLTGRVHGLENSEAQYQGQAYEGERVESDEEERRPVQMNA